MENCTLLIYMVHLICEKSVMLETNLKNPFASHHIYYIAHNVNNVYGYRMTI